MIRRRNLSHICLIFIFCFTAFEVPIALGNDGQSLQNDTGNIIQENVNQDEIISNNERSKRNLGEDKVAVQKVPRRQLSSIRSMLMIGCKSADVVSPSPIKKESIKKVASSKKVTPDHESSEFIIKAKPENSDNPRQDNGQASKNGKVSNWWSMMRKWKYATAKGLFKSQLEKSGVAFEAPEIEDLSNTVAQSLVIEVENEEKIKESKDPRLTNLLDSAKDLQKALWETIQEKGGARAIAEKIEKIKEKGRVTVERYCNCKGIDLKKVKTKDVGGLKMIKYVGVLKELGKLALQMQSKDVYFTKMLPFLKALFSPSEKETSTRKFDNKGAIGMRKKRAAIVGAALFALIGAGVCAGGIVVTLAWLGGQKCVEKITEKIADSSGNT